MDLRLSAAEKTLRSGFKSTQGLRFVIVLTCFCWFVIVMPLPPRLIFSDNNFAWAQAQNRDRDDDKDKSGGREDETKERIIMEGDEEGVRVKPSAKGGKRKTGRGRLRGRDRSRKKSAGKGGRIGRRALRLVQGPYSGVVPGKNNPPPGKLPTDDPKCLLLWPGFQWLPSGAGVVFLQFNNRAEIQQTKRKGRFELLFSGCRIPIRNNRRRLVTRFFPTVVDSVRAKNTRKGVHVTIRLKKDASAKYRWVTQKGYEFLYLGFIASKQNSKEDRGDGGGN